MMLNIVVLWVSLVMIVIVMMNFSMGVICFFRVLVFVCGRSFVIMYRRVVVMRLVMIFVFVLICIFCIFIW